MKTVTRTAYIPYENTNGPLQEKEIAVALRALYTDLQSYVDTEIEDNDKEKVRRVTFSITVVQE